VFVSRWSGLFGALVVSACHYSPPGKPAEPVEVQPVDWTSVTHYLDSVTAHGAAPGAVLGVSERGQRFVYGTGHLGEGDSSRPDGETVYDLASMTKVVALTTMTMFAVQNGKLDLDTPVWRYVPAFRGGAKDSVTIRMLLMHASGLPAWRPLYRETRTRAAALALVDTTALTTKPGTQFEYSDLGAMVLTQAVEAVLGHRIDTLATREIFTTLGMKSTRYLPPSSWVQRIAPTEDDPWRGRVLRGEVHDENASRLEGVSGHAGLFSDADDLLTFAEWLLSQEDQGVVSGQKARSCLMAPATTPTLLPAVLAEFTRRQRLVPGSSRALGWDTPSEGSSAGHRLSEHAFGHTGFTGTSIWIDPDRCLAIVLLSNRVHPTRDNNRWGPVRAQVADRVVATLEASATAH
jgi:CubicO group peptidase (beta-lactamase class C family)